jgi:hypothetical protein
MLMVLVHADVGSINGFMEDLAQQCTKYIIVG